MKGLNAMSGVLILLIISMTIFAWISTDTQVGESASEELERSVIVGEAERRLQKSKLFIQSAFKMSAQKGTDRAGNNSGRIGKEVENSYWLCQGSPQTPNKDEVSYAVSNYTAEFLEERLTEIRGIRQNWVHTVGNISCTETGYNEPLSSPENDNFDVGVEVEDVRTQDIEASVGRADPSFESKVTVKYNRYWYMYSQMKDWTETEGPKIKEKIKEELGKVDSRFSASQETCVPNTSSGADEVCQDPITAYPPNGRYPEPRVCEGVVMSAESAVKNAVDDKIKDLEQDYFEEEVSCSASYNENSGADYPGLNVKLKTGKQPGPPKRDCGIANPAVEGKVHDCITTWIHSFDVWADFEVTCTEGRFRSVPSEDNLKGLTWKINMSLTSSGDGSNSPVNQCRQGGSIPPFQLNACNGPDGQTNQCSTSFNLNGELN